VLGGALGIYRHTNAVPYDTANVKFLVSGVTAQYKDGELIGVVANTGNAASTVGTSIAYSAPYLITEDKALNEIIKYMRAQNPGKYENLTRRNVRGMLSVEVDRQVVTVSVSGPDKKVVMDVARAVMIKIPATLDYYFGVDNPNGLENIDSVAKSINDVYEDNLKHTGRNTMLFTLIGFIVGAAVVYILCILRTLFDNTVYDENDLKNRFTIPVVGQIPTWENTKVGKKAFADKSRKDLFKGTKGSKKPEGGNLMSDRDYDGRILNKKTPFAITEAFKLLRTNLCYTTKGEKCAVYGITSAYVSAGKSLIVANMAVSFAQMNKRVLLVDADLRCPVQHKVFNLDNKVNGLSDVLAGLCSYEDLYRRNGGIENLNIITSGKIPPNPAELLASPLMAQFVEKIKEDYDVVFIDLPPICEVSDAGIVSNLLTGYTFVVRAGYSDRRMIEMAVEIMEGFDASFVGFILNDIDIKSGDYYKNKYYSSYSKYRFRYGKTGYYRNFKYGYYKGYYSRYQRKYSSGYSTSYGSNYNNSYQKAHLEAVEEEEEKTILEQQENELFNENVNETLQNESVEDTVLAEKEMADEAYDEDADVEENSADEFQKEESSFRPE
jgi:capsular exopolysaccharide synthesis family protein